MIEAKDWKEYTKQIDTRNELRSARDVKEMKKFYAEAEVRHDIERRNHIERQRVNKKHAHERGEYYFESLYWPPMEFAPFYMYINDRTIEGCLDWIVKGRPKIEFI